MQKLLNAWKDDGSVFWARKLGKSVFLQHFLAVAFPVVAICSLLLYIILAHGVHILYTASFWLLMTFLWTLPASVYYFALFLERRTAKLRSFSTNDDDFDDEEGEDLMKHDRELMRNYDVDDARQGDEVSDGGGEHFSGTFFGKKKTKRTRSKFSLNFITEGFVPHKFVPTRWNGLGITACVFGIIAALMGTVCNFLDSDVPSGFAAIFNLLAVVFSMYLIIYGSMRERQLQNPYLDTNSTPSRRRIIIVGKVLFVIIGIAVVCANIMGALQSFVTVFNLHHFPPPGKLYDVGGRNMHLFCNGTGSPTVVHIHGWAGQGYDWGWVRPKVAAFSRSCSVDRPGYGWSDPPACLTCARTAEAYADDLNALFQAAGLQKDHLMLVLAAEAVLEARVFVNKYPNYNICGIVCVDCVDSNLLPAGDQKNPPPQFWDMWRNVLPSGISGIMAASNTLPKVKIYQDLPEDIHQQYIQNDLKSKFPQTVVMEYESLPTSVQQAESAGTFGSIPFVAITCGLGLNQTGVLNLSTNSLLIYQALSPHDMPIHFQFASIITERVYAAHNDRVCKA